LHRKRTWAVLLAAAMLFTMTLAGCGQEGAEPSGAEDSIKVGFVYIGTPGDAGFTYSHEQGRLYLVETIPNVETEVVENVADADAERVLTQLAESGCELIFSTSFGFMDPTINVAANYPDVKFMHCSGFKTADNVGTYFGRIYQARYLSGIVAGQATESNLIGYVAAYPIPEVIRGINAFTLGVRAVNPEATVKVVWTNTWFDPTAEKQAAQVLLEEGADVIAQHQDTPSAVQAAQEAGKFGIGYHSDMSANAPGAVLTSPVWNWGPYYVQVVQSVLDGTWETDSYWGPLADGVVDLAPFGDAVDEETQQLVETEKARIVNGEWDVFTGPIYDQDDALRVPAGEVMSDEAMLSMDWFVQGVQGNPKG